MSLPLFEKKIEKRSSGLEASSVLGWVIWGGESFQQKIFKF